MSDTLSDEQYEQLREQERAKEQVHPLDWPDDFGKLRYMHFTEFVRHMARFEQADGRQKQREVAQKLGYKDALHFGRVRATFMKYYGRQNGGPELRNFTWLEPGYTEAVAAGQVLDRAEAAAGAARGDSKP